MEGQDKTSESSKSKGGRPQSGVAKTKERREDILKILKEKGIGNFPAREIAQKWKVSEVTIFNDIARSPFIAKEIDTQFKKETNPFTGLVTGNYWTQTGMPWVSSEGRKAVLTEWFWQPIRGQPRRVDTNELRQFSQTLWVYSCVTTICDEVSGLDWDIVPKEDYEYDWVKESIIKVKEFLKYPNKNRESFTTVLRAVLKDIMELDAGVLTKVFDAGSYDMENIEPKSGAPMLKPKGERNMVEIYARDGASFLKETDKFGFVKGFWQYSYQIPAHPMWFNREEVCYIMRNQRSMSCYGYAPTQAILDVIKSLHYATLYNRRFFEETTIPDGVLSLIDTSEADMKTFVDNWQREFKAQPHKFAVINKDAKWQGMNVNNRELEFLETQDWYYRLVIAAFGLTPAELGLTEEMGRAVASTQAELSRRKGIRPLLKILEHYINEEIISEFNYEGIEFQFLYDDPAEKNQRLTNWQIELDMGIKTVNEVREELGMEPVAWGDEPTGRYSMFGRPTETSEGGENEQEAESRGYDESARREGAEQEAREAIQNPYARANQPVTTLATKSTSGEGGKTEITEDVLIKIIETYNYEGDVEELRMGLEEEQEHADVTGRDMNKIAQIALAHLKEDANYYSKLREAMKKGLRNVKKMSERERENKWHEVFYALQREGHSKERAAKIATSKYGGHSDKHRSHADHKRTYEHIKPKKKGIDDGQYYREPLQVNLPHRGRIEQPQQKPSGEVKPTSNKLESAKNKVVCPYCGHPSLFDVSQPTDLVQGDKRWRCSFCYAYLSEQELIDNKVLENVASTFMGHTSTKPVNIPNWSPKGFNKRVDLDMECKEFAGFDYEKAYDEIQRYANSIEYKVLLRKYLEGVNKEEREKIIQILKEEIKKGSSIKKIAERINRILKDEERSQTIARTETIRIINNGNRLKMQERGIKKAEWISAPEDGRLCEECHKRDGKHYSLTKFADPNFYPKHPNCRCTFSEIY